MYHRPFKQGEIGNENNSTTGTGPGPFVCCGFFVCVAVYGNNVSGDGCQANCVNPACGDGILDGGEECDDGNLTGDDVVNDADEVCDEQCVRGG